MGQVDSNHWNWQKKKIKPATLRSRRNSTLPGLESRTKQVAGFAGLGVWPRNRRFSKPALVEIIVKTIRVTPRRERDRTKLSGRNYLEFFHLLFADGRGGVGNFLSSCVSTVYWKSWTERGTHQSSQFAASARACLAVKRRGGSGRKFNLVAARASTDILLRRWLHYSLCVPPFTPRAAALSPRRLFSSLAAPSPPADWFPRSNFYIAGGRGQGFARFQ